MDLPFENPDNPQAWEICNFPSEPFADDPQYPSYDDNPALADLVATPDIAHWTPPPLQAPTVPDPAETFHDPNRLNDFFPTLDGSEFPFTPIDFDIEPPTSIEASGATERSAQGFGSEISDFPSKSFAEHPQYLSYDDNPALSDLRTTPDMARWTSLLPAPTVHDPAETFQDSTGPNDFTSRLDQFESTLEDKLFSLVNFGAAQHSATRTENEAYASTDADPLEQGTSSTDAAQAGMLGLPGPDHYVAATSAVNFDWAQPSTSIEAAGCSQTANVTTQEIPPVDGWSLIWNNTPPETGFDSAHNSAWVPPFADPEHSWRAIASPIPMGTGPAEQRPHSSSALLLLTQITPRTPNYARHLLPQAPNRTFAPILSKEPPSTNSLRVENRQALWSPSPVSHQAALVDAPAMRSGNKRTRSPLGKNVSVSYLYNDMGKSIYSGGNEIRQTKSRKRIKRDSGTCLRCQLQKAGCSGTFPCENCQQLFFRGAAKKYSKLMVQWTCCIDSKLSNLNFFNRATTLLKDEFSHFMGSSKYEILNGQSLDQYLQRVKPAAKTLMLVVEETTAKAEIHQAVGLQTHCSALLDQRDRTRLSSSLYGLKSLLSRKPLYLPRRTDYEEMNSYLAWNFAMTMLLPKYLAKKAKLSDREMQDFSFKISAAFFANTEDMLKQVKSSKKNTLAENWLILNEHLITIYFLTLSPIIRKRFSALYWRRIRLRYCENDCTDREEAGILVKSASKATAASEEGWDHLQKYTLHWLEWLQEEFSPYDRTETKPFELDTHFRMTRTPKSYDMESPAEREGPLNQEPEDWLEDLSLQSLEKQPNPELNVTIRLPFPERSAAEVDRDRRVQKAIVKEIASQSMVRHGYE